MAETTEARLRKLPPHVRGEIACRGVAHPDSTDERDVIGVDGAGDAGWWLAHPGGGELPVMPRIERSGVDNQDGNFGLTPPVVQFRREVQSCPRRD